MRWTGTTVLAVKDTAQTTWTRVTTRYHAHGGGGWSRPGKRARAVRGVLVNMCTQAVRADATYERPVGAVWESSGAMRRGLRVSASTTHLPRAARTGCFGTPGHSVLSQGNAESRRVHGMCGEHDGHSSDGSKRRRSRQRRRVTMQGQSKDNNGPLSEAAGPPPGAATGADMVFSLEERTRR
jgi:hypothetical protein